jgi:NADH-quinone oxidoreductase subunit K
MDFWQLYMVCTLALLGCGIYGLLARRDVIRMFIATEVIAKAATLSLILGGYLQGNEQIAQALVVTVILIEVISTAVGLSLVVVAYRRIGSLDIKDLRTFRG